VATAVLATQTLTSAPSATAICDRAGAGNPIDLTIPDDTRMQPGQAFTKRWALQNTGACTWSREYSARFFSGEQMSAPESVFLSGNIMPGQTVEITIDMVAPLKPGTYQGNWKLRNASNVLFGIGPNGSAPFWVKIVVVQPSTTTPTPPTTTPTTTVTSTPVNYASGSATLVPGSKIDLDSGQVNTGSGEDFSYESDAQGSHFLIPQENALIGVFGAGQPGIENCQAASMQADPLNVENLQGSYLCYRTGQGLPGRVLVTGMNVDNFSLNLEFLTWSQP
jgi:hypothetical protein